MQVSRFGRRTGVFSAICRCTLLVLSLSTTPGALAQQSQPAAGAAQVPATSSAPGPGVADGVAASQSSPSVTTLSVMTREILLDVLVTDAAGHPVTGLKASDFSVNEQGDPQVVKNAEEHHLMSAEEAAKLSSGPKMPPNTFTNFTPVQNDNAKTVILLDALDSPITAQMYLRQQLIAYLKTMHPGTSIAIFQLDTDMRLIQGFSSDPEVLLAAAESKRNMPSLQRPMPGPGPAGSAGTLGSMGTPGSPGSLVANGSPVLLGQETEVYRRAKREILREGLQAMGRYLAAFPGRKNLIWFTGEVPLTIYGEGLGSPFGDNFRIVTGRENLNELTDSLTLSRVAVYPVDSRGLQSNPQFDAGSNVAPTADPRPSANPRENFESRQAFNQFDLEGVAAQTGGKAYYNTNGLKETIAEIVSSGSNYYTLAYTTTNKNWDGAFRTIKVAVDRPGLSLQHRRGYYAINHDEAEKRQLTSLQRRWATTGLKPQIANSAQENADQPTAIDVVIHHPPKGNAATVMAASMLLGAVTPTEIVFTAYVTPDKDVEKMAKSAPLPPNNFLHPQYKDKPFRIYTVLFRADISRMRLAQTPDGRQQGKVEFVAVVYDQSGETVNTLMSSASVDLSAADYQTVLQRGMSIKSQIAVPVKGNYFLRLGVHSVEGDQIGALEIPIDQIQQN